jgi:hypothetical protein
MAKGKRMNTRAGGGAAMLPELLEHQATGRIAVIYDEIRRFSAVPYVSSLQRYLATMPGVLEWGWDAVRPALAAGIAQETGWRLARTFAIPPAPTMSAAARRVLGVDDAGLAALRNIAENFVRVSPVNLMTGACLRLILEGARPAGAGFAKIWLPPTMLAPMPGNVDPERLPADARAVLLQLATELDGRPFIPALYRQIAHWPAFLAWLATELASRFDAPETNAARAGFRQAALREAGGIVACLPALPDRDPPDAVATRAVLAAIDRYAGTSPEMTLFGRLILDTLAGAD